MEALIRRHLNRMQTVKLDFVRSSMHEIDWNDRLVMLKGQRGVGKTTLILLCTYRKYRQYHYRNRTATVEET